MNTTVEDDDTEVKIAADGYDLNTDEQLLTGTRHIVVDGEPLCGNPTVKRKVENGFYGTEKTDYPLSSYNVCGTCAKSYLANHGSNDDVFSKAAQFEYGDWVSITFEDGEEVRGRVSRATKPDSYTHRILRIVLSNEAMQRWPTTYDSELRLSITEGDAAEVSEGSFKGKGEGTIIESLSLASAPDNNIDDWTADRLDHIREVAATRVTDVMTISPNPRQFLVHTQDNIQRERLWELLDDLYTAGYEIDAIITGAERQHTDSTSIKLISPSLPCE